MGVSDLAHLILVASAASLMLGCIALAAVRFPRAILTAVLLLILLERARDIQAILVLQVGTVSLYPSDVLTLVLGSVGIARLRTVRAIRGSKSLVVSFALVTTIAGAMWVRSEGLQAGVNSWRDWMLSIAFFLWALSSLGPGLIASLRPVVIAAAVASVLQAVSIARTGFGSSSGWISLDSGAVVQARPIAAVLALMIVMGLWVLVFDNGLPGVLRATLGAVFIASIVVSQHRSAWAAAALSGLAYLVWASRRDGRLRWDSVTKLALAFGLAATAIVLAVTANDTLRSSATNDTTLQWRQEKWLGRISLISSPQEWLVGSLLGPTPLSDRRIFEVGAHSQYVELISALGLVGMVMVIALAALLYTRWRGDSQLGMAVVTATAFLTYGITFQNPPWMYLLLGACSCLGKKQSAGRRPAQHDAAAESVLSPAIGGARSQSSS